ncbi:signal peptidase I [uncultured Amnibacterium sp.]|uniref:signal peptidase I n=1 Tax=uncultured Amnibacterium sp. TaxID=1631851 RepID=UPI0035CA25EC
MMRAPRTTTAERPSENPVGAAPVLLTPTWRNGWTALVIAACSRMVLTMLISLMLVALVPTALGWHTTVVSSGSMMPKLQVGDVVVARPIGSIPLQLGQIILEKDLDQAGRLRMHRLVRIDGDGRVITRGDANGHDDSSSVAFADLLGVGALRVPYLGLPAIWLGERNLPPVLLTAIALLAVIGGSMLFSPGRVMNADPQQRRRHGRRRAESRGNPSAVG